jgi:hypothetical protein
VLSTFAITRISSVHTTPRVTQDDDNEHDFTVNSEHDHHSPSPTIVPSCPRTTAEKVAEREKEETEKINQHVVSMVKFNPLLLI